MNIARRIIDDIFGGTRAAQRILGHKWPTTIQRWKSCGVIPAQHHAELIRKGRAAGFAVGPDDFFPPDITDPIADSVTPRPEAPRDAAAS